MENASNALIIAGTILIGVMIISVGIYLVNSFGSSSSQINKQIEDTKIAEFNYSFTKYEGQETIKAHDIVSVANLAKENNNSRYGEVIDSSSPYYVKVKVKLSIGGTPENFETKTESEYTTFLKSYLVNGIDPYYFKCENVVINENTKLVSEIQFVLLP